MPELAPYIEVLQANPWLRAASTLALAFAVAVAVDRLMVRMLARVARRTTTKIDDLLLDHLARPVAISIVLFGTYAASHAVPMSPWLVTTVRGALGSFAVLVWAVVGLRLGSRLLTQLADKDTRSRALLQPRTLPIFDIGWKITVIGAAAYGLILVWGQELTAWVASAGIVGIVVGFAAQETLSSVFAGMFILMDAPYRIGDFLVLDDGTRGRVTEIGLRTTRIVTRDHVEIVLPNAIMARSKVQNTTAGPSEAERVAVPVQVAYGSDLEKVRGALLEAAARTRPYVRQAPPHVPHVRFRSFDDSGITVVLFGWLERPEWKEEAVDVMMVAIAAAFREAGVEIPFPQLDLHVKQTPRDVPPPVPGPTHEG